MDDEIKITDIQESLSAFSKQTDLKSRYWASIMYEDSAPKNYIDILSNLGLQCVISPWHDKDKNEGTGELKKKHKHILYIFDGPTTYSKVLKLSKVLNGSIPIIQASAKGAVAYWTHKNNPEKEPYDVKDMELVNIDSINDVIELTEEDIRNIWKNIYYMVNEQNIMEVGDIMDYYMLNGLIVEFKYVRSNLSAVKAYCDSKRNKLKDRIKMQQQKMQLEMESKKKNISKNMLKSID